MSSISGGSPVVVNAQKIWRRRLSSRLVTRSSLSRESRHTSVRDNVQRAYGDDRPGTRPRAAPDRPPHPRPARGDGLLAARPRRARRRLRADALPGRARRDQPDARHRRAASPAASSCRCRQLLRLDETERRHRRPRPTSASPAARATQGHTYEVLTPPLPGQRAEVSTAHARARSGHRRPRRPADARARQPRDRASSRTARVSLVCDGVGYDLDTGDAVTFDADLAHHFENPGPPRPQFFAVVSAGLRRS